MMRTVMVAAALLSAGAAQASMTVIGGGFGRACYEAAELNKQPDAALEVCNQALSLEALRPGDRAATLVNRGIIQMRAKNLTAAIADYDAALKLRPEAGEAYVNKGIALIHLGGRDKEAIALFTQGLAMKPSRPEVAYYTRGIAHELVGLTREAFDDYTQAAALKPDWAEPATQLQRFQVVRKPVAGA